MRVINELGKGDRIKERERKEKREEDNDKLLTFFQKIYLSMSIEN